MDFRSKIDGLTPAMIASKAASWGLSRLRSEFSEMWARSGGFKVKPSSLPTLVTGETLSASDAARKIHESLTSHSQATEIITSARDYTSDQTKALIDDCDRASSGEFHILGKDVDYSSGIRWHYDPMWNHEFPPGMFHSRIPQANPDGGYDIKYPWELSRLQHLPRLALGFRLTGNKSYRRAFISHLNDWIDRNPVAFGPNWACTMDVAIRAANFSYALAILNDHHLDSVFLEKTACSLIEHGRFIGANLEWSDTLTSNHYLANIAGLGILSAHLHKSVPEAESWLEFSASELESELKKQVYPDGWDFEASTAYHRLVLEMFLYAAIFMSKSGVTFSEFYYKRLVDMTRFLKDISMPDGSFPLIGDNDSGLFMAPVPGNVSNVNYILELADGFLENKSQPDKTRDSNGLVEYHDGGLYILRSDDHNDLVTFRLGQVGQKGNGGHAHNDQLSVTISFDSRPIVIDPGTALYTSDPEKRNLYRSTRMHATIVLDEMEQNPFVNGDLFTLPQVVRTEFINSHYSEDILSVTGALRGCGTIHPDEIRITREVKYDRSRRHVEIRDTIDADPDLPHKPRWIFPLDGGLIASSKGIGLVKITDLDGNAVADILYLPGWQLNLVDSVYSPAYGVEKSNVKLEFIPPDSTTRAEFIFRPALK